MNPAERGLSSAALASLAAAAERGFLTAPFGPMQLRRYVAATEEAAALHLLEQLHADGLDGRQLAAALKLALAVRQAAESEPHPVLVWSDLDAGGSRDTKVVCNELFRDARERVLLSSYSIGHKAKGNEPKGNPVLRPLAERMMAQSGLQVRLFLNLRPPGHRAAATVREIELAFASWFRSEVWPWLPIPEIYYDPRSLATTGDEAACLHAKCVVVDDQRAFVTSANLTEAAQDRNIEAGVLVDDPIFARSLRLQFESLIARGHVRRLSGLA